MYKIIFEQCIKCRWDEGSRTAIVGAPRSVAGALLRFEGTGRRCLCLS